MAPFITIANKQPLPAKRMVIKPVGGDKNVKCLPGDEHGQRNWSHNIFTCCGECGTCFLASCAPCVVYGQNRQRLAHLSERGVSDPEEGGIINGSCAQHGLLTVLGFGWVLQYGARRRLRDRYKIQGSIVEDLCSSMCCSPCALVQESREIGLEEQSVRYLLEHPNN